MHGRRCGKIELPDNDDDDDADDENEDKCDAEERDDSDNDEYDNSDEWEEYDNKEEWEENDEAECSSGLGNECGVTEGDAEQRKGKQEDDDEDYDEENEEWRELSSARWNNYTSLCLIGKTYYYVLFNFVSRTFASSFLYCCCYSSAIIAFDNEKGKS